MSDAVRAAIALGSNLDDPEAHVRRGFDDLAALAQTKVLARSKLYRTAPVGYADQPDFVNACALVETSLAPRALLEEMLAIEKRHGRVRGIPNGPRTLDLDLILYGDRVIDEPGLCVPHPRAHEREFVMKPLRDVWPDAVIPGALVVPGAREGSGPGPNALDPGPRPKASRGRRRRGDIGRRGDE